MFNRPFSFKGRIRRLEYALSYLTYLVLVALISFILEESGIHILWTLIPFSALLIFILAQGTKRCHDLGNSGFYQLIPFYVLVMLFQEGSSKENTHGPNPKAHLNLDGMGHWSTIQFDLRKVIITSVPFIILNILLIALASTYLKNEFLLFFVGFCGSIFICHVLWLIVLGLGKTIEYYSKKILLYNLLYAALVVIGVLTYTILFRKTEYSLYEIFEVFLIIFCVFYVVLLASTMFYILIGKRKAPRNPLIKYPTPISFLLLLSVLIFGFANGTESGNKSKIKWSDRPVDWNDFVEVDKLDDEFVATIQSGIICPDLITEGNSEIYAYMDPNLSEKLSGSFDSYNVLTHEQYHFNITEYCARLLRKEIVELGLGGLSISKMKALKVKYGNMQDSLQKTYDSITDHNSAFHLQRYWELQIDDWLRQTAYYAHEDVYDYYAFTKNRTSYYRNVYFTIDQKLFTSIPLGPAEFNYGEVYEIEYRGANEKVVRFYKNGELMNGGLFDTAETSIITGDTGIVEVHYRNPDSSYNRDLNSAIIRTTTDSLNTITLQYFDSKNNRITQDDAFEKVWKFVPADSSYISSQFNREGDLIPQGNGIFHEKRLLDDKARTVSVQYLNKRLRPKSDSDHVARYQWEYNSHHQKTRYKMFVDTGEPAYHLNDYHLTYAYDEWGRIKRVSSLNDHDLPTYDNNGASIYEYTYDRQGRETSIKRFNAANEPVVANDDYFMLVQEYNEEGKLDFQAKYYPGYVLKFNDTKWGATQYDYGTDGTVREFNLDAYGNLIMNNENIAIIKKQRNDRDEVIREIYLDTIERFAKTSDGVVEYRNTYDSNGNLLKNESLDSLGQAIAFDADVATIAWEYDDRGNKTKTTYFNTEGKLAISKDSITFNTYVYDSENRIVERAYFDSEMKPALYEGVHKIRYGYNDAGLTTAQYDFHTDGNLKEGVAITRYQYNRFGYEERKTFYDQNGNRVVDDSGVSAVRTLLNNRQYITGYVFYDVQDQPVDNSQGHAFEVRELNDLGHLIALRYLDRNQIPVIGPDGYHKVVYQWAPVGEPAKISFYDTRLALVEDSSGTAIYEYVLGISGMSLEVRRHNKMGELADNVDGKAVSKYSETQNGLFYLEEELNATGEIVSQMETDLHEMEDG